MLHVGQRSLGAIERCLCGEDAAGGFGRFHAQQLLTGPDLLIQVHVKRRHCAWAGSMGLEVDDGFNLAVGGDRAGEILPADARDPDLNHRLLVHVEENPHHDNHREQYPKPRA